MDRLFPKKSPEAARALLATPDDLLGALERQSKYVVSLNAAPVACPMCFVAVSVYEAGGRDARGQRARRGGVCLPVLRYGAGEGDSLADAARDAGMGLAPQVPCRYQGITRQRGMSQGGQFFSEFANLRAIPGQSVSFQVFKEAR